MLYRIEPPELALVALIRHALDDDADAQLYFLILQQVREASLPFTSLRNLDERLNELGDAPWIAGARNAVRHAFNAILSSQSDDTAGDGLMSLMAAARRLVNSKDEDPQAPREDSVDRWSPIGLWLRRFNVLYASMTYDEVCRLRDELGSWLGPIVYGPEEIPELAPSFRIYDASADADMVKGEETPIRLRPQPARWSDNVPERYDAFVEYQAAAHAGDHLRAVDSIRRFTDHRFARENERYDPPMHQHALLQLASLQLEEGTFVEARSSLAEALRIARQVNDRDALGACASLAARLDFEDPIVEEDGEESEDELEAVEDERTPGANLFSWSEPSQPQRNQKGQTAPPASAVSMGKRITPPRDELWRLKRDLHAGAPIPTLFTLLHRAHSASVIEAQLTALDLPITLDNKQLPASRPPRTWNRGVWHAIAAELWGLLGFSTLEHLHRDIALERLQFGETRTGVLAAKAESGKKEEALALLLAETPGLGIRDADETLSAREMQLWQRAILDVHRKFCDLPLVLDQIARITPSAPSMVGTERMALSVDEPGLNRPSSDLAGADASTTELSAVREVEILIARGRKLKQAQSSAAALEPILKALTLTSAEPPPLDPVDLPPPGPPGSSGQVLRHLHVEATVVLADIEIDFEAPYKAIDELERVWTDILTTDDLALRSYAQNTMARAQLAALRGAKDESALRRIIDLLRSAAEGYSVLGDVAAEQSVLMDLAVVLDQMGAVEDRDRMSERWLERDRGLTSSRATQTKAVLAQLDDLSALFARMPRAAVL